MYIDLIENRLFYSKKSSDLIKNKPATSLCLQHHSQAIIFVFFYFFCCGASYKRSVFKTLNFCSFWAWIYYFNICLLSHQL